MELDSTDIRIIEQLNQDGRASLREIAEQLDVSPSTVSNRFQRLRESGVIKGFQPVLDHEKMGYELSAVIEVSIKASVDQIPDIAGNENITSIYVSTGETDIILVGKFLDREDMYSFLRRLHEEPEVDGTETNVILEMPKEGVNPGLGKLKERQD